MTDSLYLWQAVSVCDRQSVTDTLCVCQRLSVSVIYSLFLLQTVCVCHRQTMSVTAQTGLNWFLFSLQTAKPSDKKRYCRFHHQNFWTKYFFLLWHDDVFRAEGHTAVDICVKHRILMRETCLGFFNSEEFNQSCNFGGFWWIF